MEKMFIVPESDIKSLEDARILLHEITDRERSLDLAVIISVTQPMWRLTHKRYEEFIDIQRKPHE